MDHGDLQAVKQTLSKAIPEAEFSEVDYGWTVNVGIPGCAKRYILSQVYRHGYSGHMLATKMGVTDIVASLQTDLAAIKKASPSEDFPYPFWPNGFSEEMLDSVIEAATIAAIDAYWLQPGNPNELTCFWAAEVAYDGIVGREVSDEFAASHRGRKWEWNTTWRRKTLIQRCRTRDMSVDGPPPADYDKAHDNRLPDPDHGRLTDDLSPTSGKFTVQMCKSGTKEFRAHEAATLAAIAEFWAVPGDQDEEECAEAAWGAYLRVLSDLWPDEYADPSVATLWDWEWRRAAILQRCRKKSRNILGPQHCGPLLFRLSRQKDPTKPPETKRK